MAKQIKGNDIVQSDALNPHIAELKEVLSFYKQIDAQVVKTAKDIKKISQSFDGNSAKGIQKMNQALLDSIKIKKAKEDLAKKEIQTQKEITKALQDEERLIKLKIQTEQQEIRLKKQKENEQKKSIKLSKDEKAIKQADIVLNNKLSGTEEKLLASNTKLRIERKKLNTETAAGNNRLKQINSALDQNNAKIRANSDAMKKQRLNVGNYGKAVSKVTGILKGFGATLLAAFSFQAIKGFFTSSISAFQSQEKAVAKVNQALKSTQNAVGKTSEELQKMASDLQGTTLFGDEDILNNATAQLLTFTNIAGSNFDRTQKVALDLATVLDGDLKSASIQLGKALNDPVANLSALSRSGIQFSESQKQVIKSLTESGKLAEAQTVILDELERQYGGQAEAAAEADGGLTQLSNAFGDFKEKAGKAILEGLKPFIKGLKEFFASITEKDIDNFIKLLSNLGKILLLAAKAWGAYTVATKAAQAATFVATKALKLYSFAQNVATKGLKAFSTASKANPFGLIISAIVVLLPLLSSFGDMIFGISDNVEELTLKQKVLNDVTSETADRLVDEKAELVAVFDALKNTTAGTIERKEALDKVNQKYGLTLKNLEDETAFVNQLNKAYENLVSTLEKKIRTEVIREQLTELIKERILVESRIVQAEQSVALQLEETNKTFQDFDPLKIEESGVGRTAAETLLLVQKGRLEELNNAIIALQNNVSSTDILGDVFEDVGKGVGGTTGKVKKLKTELEDLQSFMDKADEVFLPEDKDADFAAFQRNLKQNTRDFETELRKRGVSEKEIQKQLDERKLQDLILERNRALEIYGEYSQKFLDLDLSVRREVDKRNKQQEDDIEEAERKKREKQLKDAKEAANKMIEISKILADNKIAQIDREIEARKNEISVSESEIGRLQDLAAAGNVDAAESIKAERVRQAQDKIEIENLEKKKADLLLKIATLNQANLLFQQSDVNGFQNANAKVKEFVSNLPTFYDGTKGTVADALGATGTRDGHMVRVHDNEHIIGSNDSTTLHAAGLKNNADIVGSALAYQNAAANNKALAANKIASFTDSNIVSKLDSVEKAIKDIKIVQQHIDLSTGMETIVDGNKTTRNNHRPTSFRI